MTLKDVADKAGVSMMTVSNVVHGKTSRVSAKTIERVNAIIEECGYVPNLSARSLSNKSSNIIGIILSIYEEETTENFLENPYISTMIGTIEQELRGNGYYTMVRSISHESDITALLKNWNVEGIIFLHPDFEAYLESFMQTASVPIAVFDSSLASPELINICSDDQKGLYLSTKYMINHGHTHIAFVADYEGNHILTGRFQGYRRALDESGISFRPEYVLTYPPSYEGGIAAGKKIASMNHLTAAVATADICAIGVMEGARLGGLRVPADLSVIGYDNLALCQYTMPKLTSISQDIPQKARLATRLLLEKICTGKTNGPCQITMDVDIVERQSVISLF
ncbi:MAG: LacI family transcriptional regulator [Eubacterium sp.]|nr:LacI family transcriptional regulator [Eubacterium sp.]